MPGAEQPDPYVVLGVARTATQEEIRAAYLALAAQYHPDRHQGNPLAALASEKLIEVNLAYERLADRAHRRADADAAWTGEQPRTTSTGTPRPGARSRSGHASAGATARPPVRRNYGRIVMLLALLPVLARFGGIIVRGVAALLRELTEGLTLLRGTPVGAAIALAATLFLVLVLVRRLRRTSATKRGRPAG